MLLGHRVEVLPPAPPDLTKARVHSDSQGIRGGDKPQPHPCPLQQSAQGIVLDNLVANRIVSPNLVVSLSTKEHVLSISNRILPIVIINQFSSDENHNQKKDWWLQEPLPKAPQDSSRRKCNEIGILRLKIVDRSCQAVCCMNRITIGE